MRTHFDIHTHTEHSDGKHSVSYVLQEAERQQLAVFSISDHNTVTAYEELADPHVRALFSGKILTGVEISTTYDGELIEVLGYGYNYPKMAKILPDYSYPFHIKQLKESALLLELFLQKGVELDAGFVMAMRDHPESLFDPHVSGSKFAFLNEIKKHEHNARFFGGLEQMKQTDFLHFTRRMLNDPKHPLFFDSGVLHPSFEQTLEIIHKCGGLAFLAHPFLYTKAVTDHLEEVAGRYPLDGMECYYYSFDAAQRDFMVDTCRRLSLYQCGGSDFHGYDIRPNPIGFGACGDTIDLSVISPWLDRCEFL